MRIAHKDWVCLLSDDVLQAARQAIREGRGSGQLNYAWRQISLSGDADKLTLELMNVDEEAARGGYWSGGTGCVSHNITWDDLNDHDLLARFFKHEQVCVMQKAQAVLGHFREHMVPLRQALAT